MASFPAAPLAPTSFAFLPSHMFPLISASDSWTLWALITAGTALSLWLEARYRWAARLSAPVLSLLLAMILSNTGVMPTEAPAYDFIGTWLVPLALPLLLLQANVIRIARETGKLFLAVHLSTLGTVIGAFIAVGLLGGTSPAAESTAPSLPAVEQQVDRQGIPEIKKAAGIMTASYVGGMVNFLAVQDSVQASGNLIGALIVADNLVMAGFFVILLALASSRFFLRHYPHPHIEDAGNGVVHPEEARSGPLTVTQLTVALAYACGVVALALALGRGLQSLFPGPVVPGSALHLIQTLATNRFVLITLVSLVAATVFPRWLAPLHGVERIGSMLLFLFLFSIGLPADLRVVILESPLLFVFCGIIAVGNLVGTLLLGKLFRLELESLLLSVNATLGGPPTAAAMAVSRGWSRLVLPGLLAGLWGYVIGTPVGLMVYGLLSGN